MQMSIRFKARDYQREIIIDGDALGFITNRLVICGDRICEMKVHLLPVSI